MSDFYQLSYNDYINNQQITLPYIYIYSKHKNYKYQDYEQFNNLLNGYINKIFLSKNNPEELIANRRAHVNELIKLMPYSDKVLWAENKIKEFLKFLEEKYKKENLPTSEWKVLISFSGGKDSTVLLDLVVKIHKKIKSKVKLIPAYAYEITFPETLVFIKKIISNYQKKNKYLQELLLAKPKLPWFEILKQKGYPIYSKQISVILNRIKKVKSKNGLTRWIFGINTSRYKLSKNRLFLLDNRMKDFTSCIPTNKFDEFYNYFKNSLLINDYDYSEKCCDYVKGGLKHNKTPSFVGTMASESELRKKSWIHNGCNILNGHKLLSRPLSLFETKDIWKYIYKNRIQINKIYGYKPSAKTYENSISSLKYERLGCISCPYGSHLETNKKLNRFQTLYHQSKQLYYSQVIANGMYKILIDMNIKIPEDKIYMQLYELRHNQILNWYQNFLHNLSYVVCSIENPNNVKKYKSTKKQNSWEYTNDELISIFKNYDLSIEKENLIKLINETRLKINEGK